MKRDGNTISFGSTEDIVYGDLNWPNPHGYEVDLNLDSDGNIVSVNLLSDDDGVNICFNTWQEFGLSLNDNNIFDTYSQKLNADLGKYTWSDLSHPVSWRNVK